MLFRCPQLDQDELEVIADIQDLRQRLRHQASPHAAWYRLLERNSRARAIRASNSIEGYDVSVEDAIAGVENEDPMDAEDVSFRAFVGNCEALAYVFRLASDPHFRHSADLIRSLHFMMMKYDPDKNPGTWRPGWIGVHDAATGEIVYEGPDAESVPALMEELVAYLNDESTPEPPVVKAALAHLNLVMVHPFSDGNGRMARCLQTLVMARAVGVLTPTFASIEEHLAKDRRAYYDVLAEVGQGSWQPDNECRPWVRFCLKAHYFQAETWLRRAQQLARLWDELERLVAAEGLRNRMMYALSDAAHGLRVRNATYRKPADISVAVATKDLLKLVAQDLLEPHGEKRGRFYIASSRLRGVFQRTRFDKIIDDPFDEGTLARKAAPTLPGMGT